MNEEFKAPVHNIFSRLQCLLFGHRVLKTGLLASRPLPIMAEFPILETDDTVELVGATYCPRCGAINGIPFGVQKAKNVVANEQIKKEVIKKYKKEVKKLKPSKSQPKKRKK